jgi:uncharacterized protein
MLTAMSTEQTPGSGAGPTAGVGAPAGTAAPGWYPDPQNPGAQRYWDGTRWTEQVSGAQAPAPTAPATPTTTDADARQWAMFAHLSALAALFIGLPFVGPLLIYMIKKDDHPFIADQAREALNFNLSFFIYEVVGGIVTFVLILVLIGLLLIPVLIALFVAWIVLVIVAAMKANNGEPYRYPLTLRLIN